MKKFLSAVMALIMAFTCLGVSGLTASADEYTDIMNAISNAPSITLGETKSVTVNSQSEKIDENIAFIKFVPTASGYYEFICDTKPATGAVFSEVMTMDDEEIYSGMGESGRGATAPVFKCAAKLTANKTYYFMLIGSECGVYTTNVTVAKHTHQYDVAYTVSAYYEYDAEEKFLYSEDGGKYQPCLYCGYEKKLETYYAPKTMTLSYTTGVYNGKTKTPKVTIKDRKGNVISASNYKVTYKNNVKPGKATVTVKFNGKKYDGLMAKNYTIKPKKATLTSVKSNKSKQLTIKWKKDSNVSGYQIQYSTSSKFTSKTTKTVTISGSKYVQKTIKNLKSKKKYYVRVRYYKTISGKKVYGAWSSSKAATTKK